ncbi:class I SAM-dependent methyltransferase [Proteiniborus sp. MB09-C3]|uniref:class I SAM-dependent methyltransferase n=1 Tax=Proteiniborus sp. MB09-C3 TaxID=3050072 RepID=UPI002555B7CC|nr:class I SAM-dependent methyltransferase [Proteiniborus sp. MB09-C3]WIV12719.1 class I SAM-dependent methyltransferase [Proteiniborus sp. MB09-C3]
MRIIDYYENYDEDIRLVKDNAHKIEYITTLYFLDKLINKESRILDVGAGTGRYAFHFANKGCKLTALDIVSKHVDIMKEKSRAKDISMDIRLGNALELDGINDDSYDVVLCLGPLYHLIKEDDRKKSIEEALRVLRKGGILAIAYINRYATFVNYINREKDNINNEGLYNIVRTGLEFGDERDCFYYSTYHEMESLMSTFNIEKINHISTDGIGGTLRDRLKEFNDDEFRKWIEYHFMTCQDESLIGYSQHGLYICKKS